MRIYILIGCVLLSLSGCATPRVDQAKLSATTSKSLGANTIFYKSIYVKPTGANNQQTVLESALQSSLNNLDWGSSNFNAKYTISVIVSEEKPPAGGFRQSGSLTASYTLYERRTGRTISSDKIYSSSEMGLTDEFLGRKRIVLVQEDYIRKNVQYYLAQLNTIGEKEKSIDSKRNRLISNATLALQDPKIIGGQSIFTADLNYALLRHEDKANAVQLSRSYWIANLKEAKLGDAENFMDNYQKYMSASDSAEALRIVANKKSAKKQHSTPNQQINDGAREVQTQRQMGGGGL